MELIPKAVVAGMFVQSQLMSTGPASILQPAAAPVTKDAIHRIWSDVVKEHPYQSLQFDPTGSGGAFIGAGPEDVVVLQPPLVQVRDLVDLSIDRSAQKIAFVLRTVAHHLGGLGPLNLGVKIVCHAPAPGNSSVDFLLSELIKGTDDVLALAGSMPHEASVKFVLHGPEVTYTLQVEPLHLDPTFLFIDLDAQFPGQVDLTRVGERVTQVETFLSAQVRSFLERRAEGWSK